MIGKIAAVVVGLVGLTLPAVAADKPPEFFKTPFAGEALIKDDRGSQQTMKLFAADKKQRIEISTAQGPGVFISDMVKQEAYTLMNYGGQKMAMKISLEEGPASDLSDLENKKLAKTGACEAIGEKGSVWVDQENPSDEACLTKDGIMLWAKDGGQTVFEMTKLERGKQDPALFTVPEGYNVMDVGAMMKGLGGMMGGAMPPGGMPKQ